MRKYLHAQRITPGNRLIRVMGACGIPPALRQGMTWPEQLRQRTKKFALDVIRFCRTLPHTAEADVFRRQLLKSGTSVGANYRATCRGRSTAEKKAKLGIAIEESDESLYWLELLESLNFGQPTERKRLMKEADELTAIFVTGRGNME